MQFCKLCKKANGYGCANHSGGRCRCTRKQLIEAGAYYISSSDNEDKIKKYKSFLEDNGYTVRKKRA